MSSNYGALASLVVFLLGAGYYLGWHRDIAQQVPSLESLTLSEPASEPVLVLLLSPESVERVREAIARERIVASSPKAFAIDGGRIVAVDVESASDPLNAAGWGDRPIEILTADRLGRAPSGGEAVDPPSSEPPLAELAKKPTLTTGEALRLLKHLN